jgi:hypothetical protein
VIRYTLRCAHDHEFEMWFRSIGDYDRAVAAGEAACPVCGESKVEKALMTPAVSGTKKSTDPEPGKDEKVKLAVPDPRRQAMVAALRELRKQVTEQADYVGDKFAEEARKIQYNEVEPHGIYGEATSEEAQALADEGIDFLPLPSLPEDRN